MFGNFLNIPQGLFDVLEFWLELNIVESNISVLNYLAVSSLSEVDLLVASLEYTPFL